MGFWGLGAESSVFPGFQNISQQTLPEHSPRCAAARRAQGVINEGRGIVYIPSTNISPCRTSWSKSSLLEVVFDQSSQRGAQTWARIPVLSLWHTQTTGGVYMNWAMSTPRKAQLSYWEKFRAGRGSRTWNSCLALGSFHKITSISGGWEQVLLLSSVTSNWGVLGGVFSNCNQAADMNFRILES